MSQRVDKGRIIQFQHDRNILPYDDVFIAEKMKMAKSNYSNYVNGRISISKAFLNKFYTAFGEELNKIHESSGIIAEKDQVYPGDGQKSETTIELSKNETIDSKYDRVAENHEKIVTGIHSLGEKMDGILRERLNKIELLISGEIEKIKGSEYKSEPEFLSTREDNSSSPENAYTSSEERYMQQTDHIHTLKRNNQDLRDNMSKVIESNQILAKSTESWARSTEILAMNNQKLVEAHISILDQLKKEGINSPKE